MKVKIKETGEIKELSIFDGQYIQEFTEDFICLSNGFVNDFYRDNEIEMWVVNDEDTFRWWGKLISEHQLIEYRKMELIQEYGYDAVLDALENSGAGSADIEDEAAYLNDALDKLEGK